MNNPVPAVKFRKAVVPLGGVHCAACVARLEKGLKAVPGVAEISVNLSSKTAFLTYDPAKLNGKAVAAQIEALGYKALAFSESAGTAQNTALKELERESGVSFYRFLLSLFFASIHDQSSTRYRPIAWAWAQLFCSRSSNCRPCD